MISLIHPSRGRPEKSFHNTMEWIKKAGCEVEVILSLDKDDDWKAYSNIYEPLSSMSLYPVVKMFLNDNSSLVEATNNAAKESKYNILVYLSDDFKCPDNWGGLLVSEFYGVTGPMLLKVDDCLQKFDVPVLTIPIMNRALYNLLGYFFHPDFKSMHCDEHLYQRCLRLGVIKKAPHLKFEHWHVSNGKAENDETYKRSAANWDHGVQMMRKHRRLGFTQ